MSFYERYLKCCKERGIHPAAQATADQLGCSRSNISTFAKTGITPKGDIVANAAKMLEVSADYLLGLTDDPRKNDNNVSPEESELLMLFRSLNDEGQIAASAVVRGLAAQNIYKKDNSSEKMA